MKLDKLGIECVIKYREDSPQSSAQALRDIYAKEQAAFAKKHLFK